MRMRTLVALALGATILTGCTVPRPPGTARCATAIRCSPR